jgi:hypothetical protein
MAVLDTIDAYRLREDELEKHLKEKVFPGQTSDIKITLKDDEYRLSIPRKLTDDEKEYIFAWEMS